MSNHQDEGWFSSSSSSSSRIAPPWSSSSDSEEPPTVAASQKKRKRALGRDPHQDKFHQAPEAKQSSAGKIGVMGGFYSWQQHSVDGATLGDNTDTIVTPKGQQSDGRIDLLE